MISSTKFLGILYIELIWDQDNEVSKRILQLMNNVIQTRNNIAMVRIHNVGVKYLG